MFCVIASHELVNVWFMLVMHVILIVKPKYSVAAVGRGAVVARQSAGLSIEGTVVQFHLPPFRNLGNFVQPTLACVFRKRH